MKATKPNQPVRGSVLRDTPTDITQPRTELTGVVARLVHCCQPAAGRRGRAEGRRWRQQQQQPRMPALHFRKAQFSRAFMQEWRKVEEKSRPWQGIWPSTTRE